MLAPGTNPSGGTLTGPGPQAAVSGVATFSATSIDRAGNGYTLVASSAPLTSATSTTFNVTAGAAAQIAINAGNNQAATAGAAGAGEPAVVVLDAPRNPG